jgi:hypothetical protein
MDARQYNEVDPMQTLGTSSSARDALGPCCFGPTHRSRKGVACQNTRTGGRLTRSHILCPCGARAALQAAWGTDHGTSIQSTSHIGARRGWMNADAHCVHCLHAQSLLQAQIADRCCRHARMASTLADAWLFEELLTRPDLPDHVINHFVTQMCPRLQDITLAHHLPLFPAFVRLWLRHIKDAASSNSRACLKLLGALWTIGAGSPHLLHSHGLSPQQFKPAPALLAEVGDPNTQATCSSASLPYHTWTPKHLHTTTCTEVHLAPCVWQCGRHCG